VLSLWIVRAFCAKNNAPQNCGAFLLDVKTACDSLDQQASRNHCAVAGFNA
jgi:hypothetical protein